MLRGIYGTAYMFPHGAVSCVSQDNLCNACSRCILHFFCHRRGKEAEKASEIPSYSPHGYVSSSHIPQSHWKGLTHNVPQYTDTHNDPPASVIQTMATSSLCVHVHLRCCILHTSTLTLFSHAGGLFSLSHHTTSGINLWVCVYVLYVALTLVRVTPKRKLLSAGVSPSVL